MQRIGVDIGGTFTDLVVYDEDSSEVRHAKTRTTPSTPETGLLAVCQLAGVEFTSVSNFLHATTLVTNLVLTRSGAQVGLITTEGFRDVLEIGRVYRNELYNLQWSKPAAFVSRDLVAEVSERVAHDGRILKEVDRLSVEKALHGLVRNGAEVIAVCLLHSYANPRQEQSVREVASDLYPHLPVTLSSDVDPCIREYQRTSTTVLNAYAIPKTRGYIRRLDRAVGQGVKYMHSGGGVMPSTEAELKPISLIASGPAAGVLASSFIGRLAGIGDLITMDVGGTSCDLSVLRNYAPQVQDEVEVEWGIPVRTHGIDVVSVGAGGGSIAWIDEGDTLRVGPKSAGSDPGPACYGSGGTLPTVTDANLVLNVLDANNFLGGELQADTSLAMRALTPIADGFHVSIEEAAVGILRLVTANMAQAITEATVKRGMDPRDFTLVAYGGAGGQFATAVAGEVGIKRVLVPPHQSVFSAFGLLTADLKSAASRTTFMPLNAFSYDHLSRQLEELRHTATLGLGQMSVDAHVHSEFSLSVRYVGQSTELRIPVPTDRAYAADMIYDEFERLHEMHYGTKLGDPCEIVNLTVTAVKEVDPLNFEGLRQHSNDYHDAAKVTKTRRIGFIAEPVPVYSRADLPPQFATDGPCLIEEIDSTLLVHRGWKTTVDSFGNIVCEAT
ncbi:MAG: hydantoinase/oxoprolinase family protein [Nitrospiraceae bacterium]|nr:hydantoinase/oxoprolinase family protein [Nitrospiraceae bacterium]